MIACDKAHHKIVESMFNKASEGIMIGVNEKTTFAINSALHLAVLSNGPIEAKKKIITLFWSYVKQLGINLLIKNLDFKNFDFKTPIDLMEEGVESEGWLKELGNPKEDLNLLQPLKKSIEDKDFDQVESIKNKFIMSIKIALFHVIYDNDIISSCMVACYDASLYTSICNGIQLVMLYVQTYKLLLFL